MPHELPATILLIGYRGSGKTTVARQLALKLGYDWVDADVEIELAAGKSIAEIFSQEGEAGFREREAAAVGDLCRRTQTVIALGGGAVLREENRWAIGAAGPVVWLTAPVETLLSRIEGDAGTADRRPDLTRQGGRDEIAALLARRTPIYRDCATIVVDTQDKSPAEVVEAILAALPCPAGGSE